MFVAEFQNVIHVHDLTPSLLRFYCNGNDKRRNIRAVQIRCNAAMPNADGLRVRQSNTGQEKGDQNGEHTF